MPTTSEGDEFRASSSETIRVRRARRRRRLFVIGTAAALFVIATLATVAWIAFRATTISSDLNAANALIPSLRDNIRNGDSAAAKADSDQLNKHTANARKAASDPLWKMAGAVPGVGGNFAATTEIAMSADDIARLGVAPLVSIYQAVDWKSLKPSGGGMRLEPLVAAQPRLASAANAVQQSSNRLNAINASELMPQISSPLIHAREELSTLREGLNSAADAAQILPSLLGHDAHRSYLLLVQNNAELRATGGIPGALAVLNVDKGKLSLGAQTSATALGPVDPGVNVDPEQQQIYSGRLGKFFQDANLTPDFPTAAQTVRSMWEKKTGQAVDGVLAIDPVALSYVLEATGPVKLTDMSLQELTQGRLPTELTATNIVPTLLSNVYEKIPEPALQDVYFAAVAKKVFSQLSAGGSDTQKLVNVLTRGAAERRVQLWSTRSDEQSVIAKYPIGGAITGASIHPSQFGVYFNDGTGAKMDYYVKRTVQLVEECPANGYAEVKVRVTSTNTAPKNAASSLPEYVTGAGVYGVPAGTVQTNVVAYGPVQSNIETALLAGKKTGFASYRHSTRPVGVITVRLAPGQSNTIEFTFGKIVQHTEPVVAVTPTVQALKDVVQSTKSAACAPPAQTVH